MFDALSEKLSGVFGSLTGRGALGPADVDAALRVIRVALIEADVALPVARAFVDSVRDRAVGEDVLRSVTPGRQVIAIVHQELARTLGGDDPTPELNLRAAPPVAVMMAGLQGSGKTTTAAKLALRLKERERKKVLLASLDTRRPAAMEQLAQLAKQADVGFLPIVAGQSAPEIARRALQAARLGAYDVVILDTAGRTTIDDDLMGEAAEIAKIAQPSEILLVADALTGQDAVETARRFHERLPLTGLILTRIDGDSRGGAALSMRAVTGLPIKFLGAGERLDALQAFDARRVAGRILGQGDVVELVEKAAAQIDQEKAERLARKMKKGEFDLADLSDQLGQLQNMGGMSGLMGLLPGVAKAKQQIAAAGGLDEKLLTRQRAIISSMTPQERTKPDLLKASRKRRIAAGSGVDVAEVNRLLKLHRTMADAMKAASKGGMGGLLGKLGAGAGGMPPGAAQQAMKMMKSGQMPGFPGIGGGAGGGLPGLPGLGAGNSEFPGLGGADGLPGLPKKK